MNKKLFYTCMLMVIGSFYQAWGQTDARLSTTPNVCTSGPFRFTMKKMTILPLSDKQKDQLKKAGTDVSKYQAMELVYDIKNVSAQKQDIKGVFNFPHLYSKTIGTKQLFNNDFSLSYGGYYMDGYMANAPGAKEAYNSVVKSASALNDPYKPGETRECRYFIFLVPTGAKNLVFWLPPTGCTKCAIKLSLNQAVGCEIKI